MNLDINIAVVYGGVSTEREVSLKSGEAVATSLREYGYTNVSLFDLQKDNIGNLLLLRSRI